ncbi:MAG TPA: hypothetical protein VIK95_01390 [Egibacteraceae bacterium]
MGDVRRHRSQTRRPAAATVPRPRSTTSSHIDELLRLQRTAGNRAVAEAIVQRDDGESSAPSPPSPTTPQPGFRTGFINGFVNTITTLPQRIASGVQRTWQLAGAAGPAAQAEVRRQNREVGRVLRLGAAAGRAAVSAMPVPTVQEAQELGRQALETYRQLPPEGRALIDNAAGNLIGQAVASLGVSSGLTTAVTRMFSRRSPAMGRVAGIVWSAVFGWVMFQSTTQQAARSIRLLRTNPHTASLADRIFQGIPPAEPQEQRPQG